MRLSSEQDALIRHAAEVEGAASPTSPSRQRSRTLQDVLADRRIFAVEDAAWQEFQAILDRPVSDKPDLAKLLSEAPVFDES